MLVWKSSLEGFEVHRKLTGDLQVNGSF